MMLMATLWFEYGVKFEKNLYFLKDCYKEIFEDVQTIVIVNSKPVPLCPQNGCPLKSCEITKKKSFNS